MPTPACTTLLRGTTLVLSCTDSGCLLGILGQARHDVVTGNRLAFVHMCVVLCVCTLKTLIVPTLCAVY